MVADGRIADNIEIQCGTYIRISADDFHPICSAYWSLVAIEGRDSI